MVSILLRSYLVTQTLKFPIFRHTVEPGKLPHSHQPGKLLLNHRALAQGFISHETLGKDSFRLFKFSFLGLHLELLTELCTPRQSSVYRNILWKLSYLRAETFFF